MHYPTSAIDRRGRRLTTPLLLIIVFVAAAAPVSAFAEEKPSISGFYLGGGFNWGQTDVSDDDCDYFYTYVDCDTDSGDSAFGFSVNGGYRFNRYFAVETGYVDYGDLEYDDDLVYIGDLFDIYNTDIDLDLTAIYVSAVGIFPATDNVEVYIKGGAIFYDATSEQELAESFTGIRTFRTVEEDDTELFLGIGAGYSFGRYSHVRLEINGYGLDDDLLAIADDRSSSITNIVLEYHLRFGNGWNR